MLNYIDEALRRKGLSDAAASKLAVGNYALIKNMRSSRSEDKRYNYQALQRLAEVLDLECYFGPRREAGLVVTTEINGDGYVAVRRYDARLSAGDDTLNSDSLDVGSIAFRRDWIERQGLSPSQCLVVGVKGDSMAPTLAEGDLVLIDERKRVAIGRRIYALIGPDGEAMVKRLEYLPEALLLHSDNEAHPTRIIPAAEAERVRVLGEVVWWGHAVRR